MVWLPGNENQSLFDVSVVARGSVPLMPKTNLAPVTAKPLQVGQISDDTVGSRQRIPSLPPRR